MGGVIDRLVLPQAPAPTDPPPFPVIGVIAPVVLAVGLFIVLRTPTVLLLAVFSPVLAVAAVADGRLQVRRRLNRDRRRHDAALDELERDMTVVRSRAAAAAHLRTPTPSVLAADPASWAGRPPSGHLVLGIADIASAPLVAGTAASLRERDLLLASAVLPGAPVAVPASATVAVVAPEPLATAFVRAVAVSRLRGSGGAEGAVVLPQIAGASADVVVEIGPDASARIVHASGPAADCAVGRFLPALLADEEYRATVAGGGPVELGTLLATPAAGGLGARFLVGPDGPVDLDLVADGPHAVVGGTTGSGKSAMLTAWILALAAAHPPERLVLLLVDCKGGAAFDPLAGLPHVAGIVTDLDQEEAERAVSSLAAELLRRERALRDARVADAVSAGLPRLVVIVDEYRALVDRAPALAALFADVAARGRSLGVHLILCTQRPGGSVRDEVLANCAIRISLRVHDAADSRAVIGTDAAAQLGRDPVGAAIVVTERPTRVRVADVTGPAVVAAVAASAARYSDSRMAAPWCPPLPTVLGLTSLGSPPAPLVPLGRADLPEEQRQPVFAWDPRQQRRLLIVGEPGSGRTTALAAVAAGLGTVPVPADPEVLWDRLDDRVSALLVDDLDYLLDRLGESHRAAAVERLVERLRDPSAAATVVTMRGPSAWSGLPLRGLLGLFDETVLLRLGLDDHLGLGGSRAHWTARAVSGRGWCGGHRVQLAHVMPAPPRAAPEASPIPTGALLVLTERPAELATRFALAGRRVLTPSADSEQWIGDDVAVIGAPTAWQVRWQVLGAARQTAAVVVDRCAPVDLRTLLGVTGLLPPVTHGDRAILLRPEQPPLRVRLP